VGWPVLLPVVEAVCFSFYILPTEALVKKENPILSQFFSGVSGFIAIS